MTFLSDFWYPKVTWQVVEYLNQKYLCGFYQKDIAYLDYMAKSVCKYVFIKHPISDPFFIPFQIPLNTLFAVIVSSNILGRLSTSFWSASVPIHPQEP